MGVTRGEFVSGKIKPGGGDGICPCGEPHSYDSCCGRFVSRAAVAATAVELMCSRYSAFVQGDESYLLASWHPRTRPSRVRLPPEQRWLGLTIKSIAGGTVADTTGEVEFVARFKINGKGHRLHEVSRFEKMEGCWYYLDGEHL
jgi:SEC-C motif-containing protein